MSKKKRDDFLTRAKELCDFAKAENIRRSYGKAIPETKTGDRTHEILRALAELKSCEPKIAAYNAATNALFATSNNPRVSYTQERPLGRDEVTQTIRQELRRSRNQQTQGQDYRNRRTFDDRPICNYYRRSGHIAYVCRKRQSDNGDPRIPAPQNPQTEENYRSGGRQSNASSLNPPALN